MKIAVYGSLLSGMGNHRLLEAGNAKLLGEDKLSLPYGMISYGGFPALVPSSESNEIKVEIYEVDEETYRRVERLEGYPQFYQKFPVVSTFGEAEIYVINGETPFEQQSEGIKVDNGDWRDWRNTINKPVLW